LTDEVPDRESREMMRPLVPVVVVFVALALPARPAQPCSTFALERAGVVGHSFDFRAGSGLLVVNKRNVAKQALLRPRDKGKPHRWTSVYGSVTFNMVSRELPLGGINERGLVVQQMWFQKTKHAPLLANRPTINELQLIQLLLDRSATTEQALALARQLQLARGYAKLHYLICDRSGRCATLEYLGGKAVVHQGKRLRLPILTNSSYSASLAALRDHQAKGVKAAPRGHASLARFIRLASLLKRRRTRLETKASVKSTFALLDQVKHRYKRGPTQWQVVYQMKQGVVHFRNAGERAATRIALSALDFSCGKPTLVMDLRGDVTGDKRRVLRAYRFEHNAKLLQLMFKAIGRPLPLAAVRGMARYPEQATRCLARAATAKRKTKASTIPWRWSKRPDHYPLVTLRARVRRHNLYELRERRARRGRGEAELRYLLVKGGARQVVWSRRLRERVGNAGAAMMIHGAQIYIARYNRIATGCALYAFATGDGRQLWRVALRGVGSVGHSKYQNRVQLDVVAGNPVVFGYESGTAYVEQRAAQSGALLGHRSFRAKAPPRPLAERLYRELHDVLKRARSYRRGVAAFIAGHGLRYASAATGLAAMRQAVAQVDGLPLRRGRRKLSVRLRRSKGGGHQIVARAR
jgi:penicillin V acylase-like amidase (Ntn superfamily)